MSHVFISYKREDAVFAELLDLKLRAEGIDTWWDRGLQAGQNWSITIDEKIHEAAALVLIVTEAANQSPYVLYEVIYALGAGVMVIPLLLEDVPTNDLHFRVQTLQYEDFTQAHKPWDKLFERLKMVTAAAAAKGDRDDLPSSEKIAQARVLEDQAREHARVRDTSGVINTYRQIIDLTPTNKMIHYRLGYLHIKQKDLDEAHQCFHNALAIDDNFSGALAALGLVYARKARQISDEPERRTLLERARDHLRQALTISPRLLDEDGESWWAPLGGVYRDMGDLDNAITAYRRASDENPASSYPLSNLGLLYIKQSDVEGMTQTYRKVKRLAAQQARTASEPHWSLGDLLTAQLALGDVDAAQGTLNEYFDAVPPEQTQPLESLNRTLRDLRRVFSGDRQQQADQLRTFIDRIQDEVDARA